MNRKFISLALICAIYQQLHANPTGFTVVAGDANNPYVDSSGATVVESGKKTVIEWDTFSIQKNEVFRFAQKNQKSAVLNRVKGSEISSILGKLQSNGKVFLVNPQGILVGENGLVQTAGFIASTADISNVAFTHDLLLSLKNFGAGQIINLGTIKCATGDVGLFARTVKNEGLISALAGKVFLGSGPQVLLKPEGSEHLFISLDAEDGFTPHVENNGTIEALTTEIKTASNIYEKAISHSGKIEASYLNRNGSKVFLSAQEGRIEVSGAIDAPSGSIDMKAADIHLTSSSKVDVSSLIGDAGRMIVKADRTVAFEGFIDGHGQEGAGGFVELSGNTLHYTGKIDLLSRYGKTGNLMLDPKFINIISGGGDPVSGNSTFSDNASGTSNISGSSLETAINAANVILQANTDINFNDAVLPVSSNDLTLQAGRSIIFGPLGDLELSGGDFIATVNDAGAIAVYRDPTTPSDPTQFSMQGGAIIRTFGGDITISPGNFCAAPAPAPGACPPIGQVSIDNAIVNAGGGTLSITGVANPGLGAPSVSIRNGSIVTTVGSGDITILGDQSTVASDNVGIDLFGSASQVTAVDGDILLTGFGNADGGSFNVGVRITDGAAVNTTGSGKVTLDGTGGDGVNGNYGVQIKIAPTSINSGSGGIEIIGHGGGNGQGNNGMLISENVLISAINGGDITIEGHASGGTNFNDGVSITHAATSVTSDTGDISITGFGGAGNDISNKGVALEHVTVSTGAAGSITLFGTGGTGTASNDGVLITNVECFVTTVDGPIDIRGIGGGNSNGGSNSGVNFLSDAHVIATGSGTITIHDTVGGNGTNGNNNGLNCSLGQISSNTGAINISATGGSGGSNNDGIAIFNGSIISSSSAQIKLNGVGGIGSSSNHGVQINGLPSTQISTPNSISITGSGGGDGTGNTNTGVNINNVTIPGSIALPPVPPPCSPGAPIPPPTCPDFAINIQGQGGTGVSQDVGVVLVNATIRTNDDQAICITGTGGGTGTVEDGVFLISSLIDSTCNGVIKITGNSGPGTQSNLGVGTSGGVIQTLNGDILINGISNGTANFNDGIQITGGAQIISNGDGNIKLSGQGAISGTDHNNGIYFQNNSVINSSSLTGNIELSGIGGGTTTDNNGIRMDNIATVTSTGSANILLTGMGGNAVSNNDGILLLNTNIDSTGSGDISIIGIGVGAGFANLGVQIDSNSTISSSNFGTIDIQGDGGTGAFGIGVGVIISTIETEGGPINILGTGHGIGAPSSDGVDIFSSTVQVASDAVLTITGNGSVNGTDNNIGVQISATLSEIPLPSTISAVAGAINITGNANATGTSNEGVTIHDTGTLIFNNGGPINIIGTGGPGDPTANAGVHIFDGAMIRTNNGDVNITTPFGDIIVDE